MGQDAPKLHVVFSAECNPLFDWHSAALFYSFRNANFSDRANITRLLACSQHEQTLYDPKNLQLGPTFLHRNLRNDSLVDEVGYPSYNKPYSVHAWLQSRGIVDDQTTPDEYILMTDADMIFRKPVDPQALGCKRGVVVSAEYTYLIGTTSGFAERFIAKDLVRRLAQVGGFHIFHAADLRRIAPLWLEYTKRVRAFAHQEPDTFFHESMMEPESPEIEPVRRKQAMWHSEMYGYVFAAAEVGVTHHTRRDVMLYPGYEPYMARGPNILHYGSDYTVQSAHRKVYFNKMAQTTLRLESCPSFLWGAAKPSELNFDEMSLRDSLCWEHLAIIDASFCAYYKRNCGETNIPPTCRGHGEHDLRHVVQLAQEVFKGCKDQHHKCGTWSEGGECNRNPLFMHSSCPVSCKSCGMSLDDLFPDEHLGDWKWKEEHGKAQEQDKAQVQSEEESHVELEVAHQVVPQTQEQDKAQVQRQEGSHVEHEDTHQVVPQNSEDLVQKPLSQEKKSTGKTQSQEEHALRPPSPPPTPAQLASRNTHPSENRLRRKSPSELEHRHALPGELQHHRKLPSESENHRDMLENSLNGESRPPSHFDTDDMRGQVLSYSSTTWGLIAIMLLGVLYLPLRHCKRRPQKLVDKCAV